MSTLHSLIARARPVCNMADYAALFLDAVSEDVSGGSTILVKSLRLN